MDVRFLPNHESYQRMSTEELRHAFLIDRLFVPGEVSLVYCDTDRAIVGGAVPRETPLPLLASRREMAAEYFAERREIGVVNIGAEGGVRTDGVTHMLRQQEMLYIGRGTRQVEFLSTTPAQPAQFYFVSFPAHATYPTTHIRKDEAEKAALGSPAGANVRTINRYIHPAGVRSCQLVMGLTELAPGSVWNTMPPHTHQRRMEVYLYCGLAPESVVVHLMGTPAATRSVILRDGEAVISPSWSIHCAVGTTPYTFIWAMGGENQEFGDMDGVNMRDLR